MSPLWALLSSLLLAGLGDGLSPFYDTCPQPPTVENFNLTGILGKWYQIEHYPYSGEKDLHCISSEYRRSGNGSDEIAFIDVAVGQDGKVLKATGNILREGSGLKVRYDTSSAFALRKKRDTFKVAATDYINYIITWYCEPHYDEALAHLVHFRSVYVLTRSQFLDQATNKTIDQNLESMNISRSDLTTMDQKNCPSDIENL